MTIDIHSEAWQAVKRHAEQRLADLRRALEAPGLEPTRTEFVRGEIRALSGVLSLAGSQKRQEIAENDPDYNTV